MAPFSPLFRTRAVLAPMVRSGQLPLRLLALRQGAGLVYSEELVDRKLGSCRRVFNAALQTVDFVAQGRCVLRTNEEERGRLIVQIGSADVEHAVAAARMVAGDCAGIDLNMGCPASFSTHAGMGSGLLRNLDTACAILTALVQELHPRGVAVSAKVRLLDTLPSTVDMMRRLQATGIDALAVHCRRTEDRPRVPARLEWLPELVAAVDIPLIANGDMWQADDIDRILRDGAASAMVARGALKNLSVFNNVHVPFREILRRFTWLAIQYNMPLGYAKYTIERMINENPGEFTQSERLVFRHANHFQTIAHKTGITEEQYRTICGNVTYPWSIDDESIAQYDTKKLKMAKLKEIEERTMHGWSLSEGARSALDPVPPIPDQMEAESIA